MRKYAMAVWNSCRRFVRVQTTADLVLWAVVVGAVAFEVVLYLLKH